MNVLGPLLILALAAAAAVAWIVGGPIAFGGALVGLFISAVPCWIPFQAMRKGEDHGKAVLQATAMRFLSALVVAAIAELTQPRDVAKTFLLGMAASYLVMLAAETFYFSQQVGKKRQDGTKLPAADQPTADRVPTTDGPGAATSAAS